jgi:hypothetical protein
VSVVRLCAAACADRARGAIARRRP